MRAKVHPWTNPIRAAVPYLWGFSAAAALDGVVDIRALALPILAVALAAGVGFRAVRRAGR